MTHNFLLRFFVTACLSILVTTCSAQEIANTTRVSYSANRPNIVLVFIDDMGWGDFSCFGNRDAKTPNIDRLATEGLQQFA